MEFGSDFHTVEYPKGGKTLLNFYPDCNLYATGRQALLDLAIARGWKRLWVPSYFCEETLDCISRAGIALCQYNITPFDDPSDIVPSVPVNRNDGLLIVNYFGLFNKRSFSNIDCEIVEDHTHNLIGSWALNSEADWCIASLRKTLPIADGGILWSPKHHRLPDMPVQSEAAETVMVLRRNAMDLKRSYLSGQEVDKGEYLELFSKTEDSFDLLPVSRISDASYRVIKDLDVRTWYGAKHSNWDFLYDNLKKDNSIRILSPENTNECPFSLVLLFKDNEVRNSVRKSLISRSVYPAILWTIESRNDKRAKEFGDTMLSIHCDGRYSLKDMENLLSVLKDSLI